MPEKLKVHYLGSRPAQPPGWTAGGAPALGGALVDYVATWLSSLFFCYFLVEGSRSFMGGFQIWGWICILGGSVAPFFMSKPGFLERCKGVFLAGICAWFAYIIQFGD